MSSCAAVLTPTNNVAHSAAKGDNSASDMNAANVDALPPAEDEQRLRVDVAQAIASCTLAYDQALVPSILSSFDQDTCAVLSKTDRVTSSVEFVALPREGTVCPVCNLTLHSRFSEVKKFQKWYRSCGYDGPPYCKSCSQVRRHI